MIKSAILEEQKAQLKKEELAARILNQSRNKLYLKLRYLDLALEIGRASCRERV